MAGVSMSWKRSMRRSAGNFQAQTRATTIEAAPPSTTAGTAPISAAATPDSKAPSSLEAPMKTRSTAPTRPRREGAVRSGASVPRIDIETMSAPARAASATIESAKLVENPNTIVKAPYSATTTSSVRPTRRFSGRPESTDPTTTAPIPGAARSSPLPNAPTCRIVWEKTGKSAVAPPNSTAIRSSEIAPSSAGVSKMKRTPARASDRLASCSATCARPIAFGTSITITIASTAQTAAKA